MDKQNEDSLLPPSCLTTVPDEKYQKLLWWGQKGLELMRLKSPMQPLVISDSDVTAAINHLNSLPHTRTKDMPPEWGKKQLIEWVLDSLPSQYGADTTFPVGTGVWGHIKPLGYEFSNYPNKDNRLQILLSIRPAITDLNKLTTLEVK